MSVVVSLKAIKPKPLKVDAIRLELLNALRKEGTAQRKELKKTVRTWRDKPRFESLVGLERKAGGSAMVVTGPVGSDKAVAHWVWTDQGTRPHTIVARRAPTLKFRAGFVAKTRPRRFSSRRGRSFGPWRSPRMVRHPGTKPREWTKLLAKKRKKPFDKRMQDAMKRGAFKVFL